MAHREVFCETVNISRLSKWRYSGRSLSSKTTQLLTFKRTDSLDLKLNATFYPDGRIKGFMLMSASYYNANSRQRKK